MIHYASVRNGNLRMTSRNIFLKFTMEVGDDFVDMKLPTLDLILTEMV